MITTIFDTETTGLYQKGQPLSSQPYVVQLAAIQYKDDKPIGHLSAVIKNPEVKEMSTKASDVHGWTVELINEIGVAREPVFDRLTQMLMMSDRAVAHNSSFDVGVMLANFERTANVNGTRALQKIEQVCTMNSAIPIVKKRGRWSGSGYGWPKLEEAYEHFTGKKLKGAHDAMVDVRGCATVYFNLLKVGAKLVGGV